MMTKVGRLLIITFCSLLLLSGCSSEKKLVRLIRKERFDKGLTYANKVIAAAESRKSTATNLEEALPIYMGVGRIHRARGDYQKAEVAYRRAREVSSKRQELAKRYQKRPTHTELNLLDELAEVLLESGNYVAAGEMLEQTMSMRKEKYGSTSVKRYRSYLPYGQYLVTLGKYEEAYTYLKDHALFIRNKLYNTFELQDFDRLAEAYEGLARLEYLRGNISEAKRLAYKNLKYQDHRWAHKLAGKNNLNRIESLNLVARCEIYEGSYATALTLSDKSLEIYNDVLSEPTIHKVSILLIRADIFWRTKRLEEAFKLFHEANEIQLRFIKENLGRLTEYEQANFARQTEENIQFFYRFAKDMLGQNTALTEQIAGEVYNVQINTKAKLLAESSKRMSTLANHENPEVKSKFEAWRSLRYEYARTINVADGNARETTAAIQRQISALEKELSLQVAGFGTTSENTDWNTIAASLNEDEVAVETIRIKNRLWKNAIGKQIESSYLFLTVTKNATSPSFAFIPNGDTIENRLFRYYSNSKSNRTTDTVSYNAFFKPLVPLIGKNRTIYFSADGIYNFINLAILTDNNNYLLDRYTIINTTNTRNIRQKGHSEMQFRTATLFGRPQYSDAPLSAIEEYKGADETASRAIVDLESGVPDLPGTEWEVNVVQKLLSDRLDVAVKLRADATEEAIKNVESTDIIHVATHGFFINDPSADPMLTSGLLFSGATATKRSTEEDGLFTAYEAAALQLPNTSLVVLSACETGLGEIRNGEGVYGLQRAFEIAGARNILMSLWKIDDVATVKLMEGFYSNLVASGNPAVALRRAQDMMRTDPQYAHPYYWGAFKLVGE